MEEQPAQTVELEEKEHEELISLSEEAEARYRLIVRGLKEVIGANQIRQLLKDGKDPKIYWGTATTGKPHLGYFVPIYKISDYLAAGCHVTILFADLHGFLDNNKSNWELLHARCDWYEFIIKEMLRLIDVPLEKLTFTKGTEYQLSAKYTLDMYKMSAIVTTEHTKKAGAEVVKMTESPLMSNLLYPILQALDEEYLDVDIQFGGVDQRKIFMFARANLPRIGYKKRSHLMNTLIPGLGKSGKMSSSEPLSKVDFDDTDKEIKEKFKQAFSVDGQPIVKMEDGEMRKNGMLAILKHILFRYLDKHNRPFVAPRPQKWGGPQTFKTFKEVKEAFARPSGPDSLASGDLKNGISDLLIEFLSPLRKKVEENYAVCLKGYPGSRPWPSATPGKGAPAPKGKAPALTPAALDLRVGKVLEAKKVEGSEKLYVEQIDVGEDKPRTICSGLAQHIPLEKFQGSLLLVFCNLKPAKLMGIESQGMVLAASTREKEPTIELVQIPEGARVGERVSFAGFESSPPDTPYISNAKLKKLLKDLHVNDEGVACYKDAAITTSAGPCRSNLKGGALS